MNYLDELKALPKWCAFRPVWDAKKGRVDKPPVNVRTGYYARPNVLNDWTSYDEAVNYAMRQGLYSIGGGVGFLFTDGDCYAGIDLDHVIDEAGNLKDFAADIVAMMDSYTEYSPSGKGLHILFKLTERLENFYRGNRKQYENCMIEIYDSGHYFTMTEKSYGEPKPIEERTDAAKNFCERYMKKEAQEKGSFFSVEVKPKFEWQYREPITEKFSNSELRRLMFENEQNGAAIRALYDGDVCRYGGDHSAADIALCNHLAFWTGGDEAQMDSMFRESGLMRPKWDEKHYKTGEKYGEQVIRKAIQDTPRRFEPKRVPFGQKFSEISDKPIEQKNHELDEFAREAACKKENEDLREEFSKEAVSFYLNDFIKNLKQGREGLAIPTGFFELDELLDGGLYPGLYIVGAISSLGKTTLCLQIADQIAAEGRGVLVFSLEMSRNELIAKSLSRQSLILDLFEYQTTKHAKTTRGILKRDFRSETETQIISRAIENYLEWGEKLFISEGVGNIGVNEISEKVSRFVNAYDTPPVVVIDYLQILSPFSEKATDKQNIDKNVLELKRMSRDFEIPIIGISSFNRENYNEPVSMASFKESGAIEYSSDVLIGLQYKGFDYKEGEKDTERKKRIREILQEANDTAKRGEAVKVQCKILKHRNGRKGSLVFDFYPMFNYFREMENIISWQG